ncbi:MAG: ATP-binding protein [Limnospira sp.]
MEDEKLLARSHLQVQTDLQSLEEILAWFEKITAPFLASDLMYRCQIAITEGFTNVVRHAHRELSETTPIDIEVTIFSNCIEMQIWDAGKPFDLEKTLHLIREQHLAPLEQEGGRGLMFMSKLTDELTYRRVGNSRNCLTLRKRFS